MSKQGQFRCKHCGCYFDLDADEQEIFIEGYFDHLPDTCEDCCDMINHPPHEIEFSDADVGL